MIRLYPACSIVDDTYTEGVTNVLLSFFGALLNHHVEQAGLRLHTERRQSFGFLRPTITDAGCLMLRLSLGLEPRSFDAPIVSSLKKFDELLEQFKFDQKTDPSVSKVFESCTPPPPPPPKVAAKIERKPRASDTHIRSVVRKDDRILTTFRQAKAYIDQVAGEGGSDYLKKAMENFLTDYVCKNKTLTIQPHLHSPEAIQVIESPVVNLLKNTVAYAFNFVKDLNYLGENEPLQYFSHVYLHSLLKLFVHCDAARSLLTQIEHTAATEFYHQALCLTENILEYLISLDSLRQIRMELQKKTMNPIAELRKSELTYAAKALQLPEKQLQLFFTDSGQQAITTSLLILSMMLHGRAADGKGYDKDIHLFGGSYYEVAEFIKDCKKEEVNLEMKQINQAKIVFIDVSQLGELKLEACPALMALVIDMTHHPFFDQEKLRQIITAVHKRGIWVTLVESSLKHAQLGLDKYQAGKIITLAPVGLELSSIALNLFERVSKESLHPAAASYLGMVNAICREKQVISEVASIPDKIAIQALVSRGFPLGGSKKIEPKPTEYFMARCP